MLDDRTLSGTLGKIMTDPITPDELSSFETMLSALSNGMAAKAVNGDELCDGISEEDELSMAEFKDGAWAIYELKIVQIAKISGGKAEYSDGFIRGYGAHIEHFRPLSLRNKVVIETLDTYYNRIRDLDGSAGFNFPDIHRYFSEVALEGIDGDDAALGAAYDKAQTFVRAARDYQKTIDGVRLFRPR